MSLKEQPLRSKPDEIEVIFNSTQLKLLGAIDGRSPLTELLIQRHAGTMLFREWGPAKKLNNTPSPTVRSTDPRQTNSCKPKALPEWSKEFLNPVPTIQNEIHELPEWKAACNLLREAVAKNWIVSVFGDFDCDGVCSVTLMLDLLVALGVHPDKLHWFIPHRLHHGYGVTRQALEVCLRVVDQPIKQIKKGEAYFPPKMVKPQLLVVVDCGTNSMELLNGEYFSEMQGVRALVIDHHHLHDNEGRTEKIPLLNPWAFDEFEHSDLRGMCASGLIYLLALSLKTETTRWNEQRATILAGLASVADVMPMFGTSRAIVKSAIRLAQTNHLESIPGLYILHNLLMQVRHRDTQKIPPIDENTFGFQWGPCLNACGRIDVDCATAPVELLTHAKREHLEDLADFVYDVNCRRMNVQQRILKRANQQALAQVGDRDSQKIILATGANWHVGVVGIVAARLRDIHNRPAIVCGWDGKLWRGSGRSTETFHIGNMIKAGKVIEVDDETDGDEKNGDDQNEKYITSGGGHEMACGLKFQEPLRPAFQAWLNEYFNKHNPAQDFSRIQHVLTEAENFSPLEWAHIKTRLRPYGRKNEDLPIILQNARLDSASLRLFKRPDKTTSQPNPPVSVPIRPGERAAQFGPDALGINLSAYKKCKQHRQKEQKTAAAWSRHQKQKLFAELRRGELSGLIVGTFIPVGNRRPPVVVTWFNVRRALREWLVGQTYMLQLATHVYHAQGRRVGRFTVLNSWDDAAREK